MTSKLNINVGDIFGHWRVVYAIIQSSSINKQNKLLVQCECVCGVKKFVNPYSLVNNKSKSCGCRGLAIPKTVIYKNLERAKRLGSVNNLKYEDISNLYSSQSGQCCVTNIALNSSNAKLDRIDITQPYQINNVGWVTNAITPITTKIGIAAAQTLNTTTNIFQNLGMTNIGENK